MHKERSFRVAAKRWLDDAIHAALSLAGRIAGAPDAYLRLLHHVRPRTDLLRLPCDPRRIGRGTEVNAGLFALALHHADWLRAVEAWEPPLAGFRVQFASMAAHLLALYPVPACMTSVWFLVPPGEPHPEQEWYKHLGRGQSLQTASLPLPFTRRMAHHFGQAPHHYSVKAAMRWAQVRGLGGNTELACAVAGTRLGSEFAHEDFWLTVLRFFVRAANLGPLHVRPIVDFLHAQRFRTREVFIPGQGIVPQGPPHPDFQVRGRTVPSLLRQVEEWHRHEARDMSMPGRSWSRSPIREFQFVEDAEQQVTLRCWTIRELLSSGELFCEGQAMQHCVADYIDVCYRRETSIWSMQFDQGEGPRRSLTVEVDLARNVICQARGRNNRLPRQVEREMLEQWAKREGLQLAECL
jgi:hypothetical protein